MRRDRLHRRLWVQAFAVACGLASSLAAFQAAPPAGKMWLLEDAPVEHIREVYGVELTPDWLEKTRLCGLRFGGGTASFVSDRGLILTNHHVVRGFLSNMEHDGKNLGSAGYVARSPQEELRIPGANVVQLVHVEDVTDAVFAGVDLKAPHEEVERSIGEQRQSVLARAKKAHPELVTELVSLYRGARVHLYSYKAYSDVRIVFAPELALGYFGGELDNFRYPRYALDFSLCRVYENDAPLDSQGFHFGWSDGKLDEGEAVFTLGNPGSTDRMLTVAELEYRRDALYPARTSITDDFLAALEAHAKQHPESEARLRELAFGISNGYKATVGHLQGLRNEARMAARRAVEQDLRARLASNAKLAELYGDAWDEIELALEELVPVYQRWWYHMPWFGQGQWFEPLARAVALVEDLSPDFADENRIPATGASFLFPFEPEVFAAHLARGREVLGADDPGIAALLRGKEPAEAVRSLLAETRIGSSDFESELRAGGWEAVEASTDPAIAAARVLYPLLVEALDQKKLLEDVVELHAIRVGKAIDALEGPVVAPEASFSQRLSAGTVLGYTLDGQALPASTNFAGLYERCAKFGDTGEFDLPDAWFAKKDGLDLARPLNFVCTADSTGGSSGSPVFDAERRIVGVLFDGNEQGTENEFVFQDGAARSIAVASAAMLEVLTKVYDAPALAAELKGEGDSASKSQGTWRTILDGSSKEGWEMSGPGEFVQQNGELETRGGLGLLYYAKEKLGDCQIRVVFKPTQKEDNSGVFIRIAERPTDPWIAVNGGYEIQIANNGDSHHRTGCLYSLTEAKNPVDAKVGEWNTFLITLDGPRTVVELNGTLITDYTEGQPVPAKTVWYEPERGVRTNEGYFGLQNHGDPARVRFKEVSVRPLR